MDFYQQKIREGFYLCYGLVTQINEKESFYEIKFGNLNYFLVKSNYNYHKLFKPDYAVAFICDELRRVQRVIPNYGGNAYFENRYYINTVINWEGNAGKRIAFPIRLKARRYEPTLTFADNNKNLRKGENLIVEVSNIRYNGGWECDVLNVHRITPPKREKGKTLENKSEENPFLKAN